MKDQILFPDMVQTEPKKKKRAKATKEVEEIGSSKELYHFLYQACDILRGPVSQDAFKEYLTPLLYFKRISDVYDEETQEALDNAMYNFKFTIDSMFKPVDSYVKSKEVKTSNILRDLIYIAEYKSKIRECQIRSQLPKSKRSSFFNYATDQIGVKKKSYTQKYPPIPQYPNEQQVREPEIYQPILEQSKKYREEGRRLRNEWERMMRAVK